jgi:hypothetical protein
MPETKAFMNPLVILGEAERILSENGYHVEREREGIELPKGRSLVAEDIYGIIALVIYDTWTDLEENWANTQGAVVDFLSKKLPRTEPKTWEAYLLLITPIPSTDGILHKAEEIRHDVTRLRKLVITGDDLKGLNDVERILRPLLPLEELTVDLGTKDLLDMLPELFSQIDIDRGAAEAIVEAYKNDEPLLERLHRYQQEQ